MRAWEWQHSDNLGRVCVSCKEYKLYSEYHKHSGCKFGYNTVCKLCRHPKSKAQYQTHSKEYKLWYTAKSRAKRKKLDFNIDIEDIQIPQVCPLLKVDIIRPSLDRIDNTKGYVKGNVRVVSYKANRIKNNLTIEEIKNLYEYVCEI
jgi:hypothetical protein